MKTQIIITALLLGTTILSAQNAEEKTTTIRVKKVVNVKGVEKISDTTYTVKGPVKVTDFDDLNGEGNNLSTSGKQKQMVIVTDEVHGDNFTVVDQNEIMDQQIQNALKATGVDGKEIAIDKIMVVNDKIISTDENGSKTSTKIIVVKTIKLEDANSTDTKALERSTGTIDQKLKVDQMLLYPNPNTGKFNLKFNLPEKGNTEITILNSEGKLILKEELKDFSGNYDKEIDISNNPKGIYFVKIKQGEHSQLKKLILN